MLSGTVLAPAGALAVPPLGQQVMPPQDAPSTAPTSSLRSVYIVHCAGCHGRDAAGSTTGRVPDMRRMGRFLQVDGGRAFLVSVPGVLGAGLDDRQIADLTNWLLGSLALGSAPADAPPYTAAEVQVARRNAPVDVAAARRTLVQRALEQGLVIE
jgi:mono/diheme cytochrome c family protein